MFSEFSVLSSSSGFFCPISPFSQNSRFHFHPFKVTTDIDEGKYSINHTNLETLKVKAASELQFVADDENDDEYDERDVEMFRYRVRHGLEGERLRGFVGATKRLHY